MAKSGKSKASSEEKNIYQVVAIIFAIIIFFVGTSLSNNFSLTLTVWGSGFVSSLFLYGFGEIIKQLKSIKKALNK